jgi:hypothetical protein
MAKKKSARPSAAARSKKSAFGKASSKSAAIRAYLQANPEATNPQVVAALAEGGMDVSESLISHAKQAGGRRRKKRKVVRRPKGVEPQQPTPPMDDLREAGELMVQAVDLVVKAGGKEAAQLVKMAVEMVKKISERK